MPKLSFLLIFSFIISAVHAQNADAVKKTLKDENSEVVNNNCVNGTGEIITPKALNIFLGKKVGSYLSEGGDLSLFKTYATVSGDGGKFSLNHNFAQVTKPNGRIKGLTTVGIQANISNGFATIFKNKKFSNELGITIKQTWISRGTTRFDNCIQVGSNVAGVSPPLTQKTKMNVQRASILYKLYGEIDTKAAEFEKSLAHADKADVAPLEISDVITELRKKFYDDLQEEYENKFEEQQANALANTGNFKVVKDNWFSLVGYIPVTTQKFTVAPGFNDPFNDEEMYPFTFTFSHSRFWQYEKGMQVFLNLSAGIVMNNSVTTGMLDNMSLAEYKIITSTDSMVSSSSDDVYVGEYKKFITPTLKVQGVYFPNKSFIGFSLTAEKDFGKYNPFNGRIGLPVHLNDKDGDPTITFELQVRFFDLGNKLEPDKSIGKKTSVGFTIGLPFNSFIY